MNKYEDALKENKTIIVRNNPIILVGSIRKPKIINIYIVNGNKYIEVGKLKNIEMAVKFIEAMGGNNE